MIGVLGGVGQVVSVVLLVVGAVAMYAAALLLWQPTSPADGWRAFLLLAAGALVILAGLAVR